MVSLTKNIGLNQQVHSELGECETHLEYNIKAYLVHEMSGKNNASVLTILSNDIPGKSSRKRIHATAEAKN